MKRLKQLKLSIDMYSKEDFESELESRLNEFYYQK